MSLFAGSHGSPGDSGDIRLDERGNGLMKLHRIQSLLCVMVLLCCLFSGCKGESILKTEGGTVIDPPAEKQYDFAASWLTKRSDFSAVNEDWRVGALGGNSVKITSGKTEGVCVWYSEELPESYILHTTISLAGIEDAVEAGILLGEDKDTTVVSFILSRTEDGAVSFSLNQGDRVLTKTESQKLKDTDFAIILDKSNDDGTLVLHVQGNEQTRFDIQTEPVEEDVLKKAKMLFFSANRSGVVFTDIAADVMVYHKGDLLKYAQQTYGDLLTNFATGNETDGYYYKIGPGEILWGFGMAILPMETMYDLTGNEQIKKNFQAQWEHIQNTYTDEALTAPGYDDGGWVNPACDDAAWTAMTLMSVYRMTGDTHALDLAAETVRRSYDYWMDGSTSNGLWYRYWENTQAKSVYCAGLILTALEYHEITKGTDKADPELYADTMALYEWVETNCRREDNLYFCDYYDNKETGESYPLGHENPDHITYDQGSCSALFANTGMAAINAKLYKMTRDKKYLELATKTANALETTPYNRKGILVNDRDAWTDAAFMRYFVNDVLRLEGISGEIAQMLKRTSISIMINCRTEDGYYHPKWSGGARYPEGPTYPQAEQIMTTATTVHMTIAAALAEKIGLI